MIAVVLLTAMAGPLGGAASVASAAPVPLGLSVDGGEESWHPTTSFALRWSNPPGTATVHYRLLSPAGEEALAETEVNWPAVSLQHLLVPEIPGAYTAEVWLADAEGNAGPAVSATLRYDDARPGPTEPLPSSGWIGRAAFPYGLHIAHPAGAEPLSGIRGYAVSVDRSALGAPCSSPFLCSPAETDLHAGVATDTFTVDDLDEGLHYVHAVAVSGSGVRSAATGTATLKVDTTDPVTALSGAAEGWSNRPLRLTATASDAESGMGASGSAGPFTAIRIDGGAPIFAAGDTVEAVVIDSGVHRVEYYARDAAGNADDGALDNGRRNRGPAAATVRIDRDPPAIAFVAAQDPREPERIEAHASDPLSGLTSAGASIGVRRAGSEERLVALPTRIEAGALVARWSSELYPAGEYEFRATVHDRAGNASSTARRANGEAMRLRNPLKTATALHADSGRRLLPYGRGWRFSGRLLGGRGAPMTAATVRVIERFAAGARRPERVTTLATGEQGEFSVRLRPGPSREVLARFAGSATHRSAASEPLQLGVRGGVRLRVSSPLARVGGRPVVFSGTVGSRGASIPAEGKSVELQFRLPGLAWSEFRAVRTDPRGRFRYPYRFTDDDSRGARFQFRAVAPAQAGWPYEPAGSAPVAVLGA